jgi:deoxyribonuclease-4
VKPHGDSPPLIGAHVSTQGGVVKAPARGRTIGANVIQVFTKNASQWREITCTPDVAAEFREQLARHRIVAVTSHDSYLINVASPDPAMRARSEASFIAELRRCEMLGIPWVVSHPGNYMDYRAAGLRRNAESYARCLASVPGRVRVAIEGTAACGTQLGGTFEELRRLRDLMPAEVRERAAYCLDTCHLHVAGYDLVGDFDAVWREFDEIIGFRHLAVMHLNDAKAARGSRLDRHELLGEGQIGKQVFQRIMTDPRFTQVLKILETPKGDDLVTNDRRMMRRLKAWSRPKAPGRPKRP